MLQIFWAEESVSGPEVPPPLAVLVYLIVVSMVVTGLP